MNAKDYEYIDLKDIRKETTIGFNVTIYPNTVYNARDNAGAVIFDQGQRIKQVGTTISSGIQFGYVNENRDIKATIGNGVTTNFDTQGVNRDIEKAVGDWQGINIETFSMDLGTEYWLTQAGRGALLDQIDDAKRGYKGLKRLLGWDGTVAEKIEAEQFVRELIEKGLLETDGKSKEEIGKEIQERFGEDIDIKFYNGELVAELTGLKLIQLNADGFAVNEDGSIWINVDKLDNNTLDFNKLFVHEYAHSNGLNEVQAHYVENAYTDFLSEVSATGYITVDGKIDNWQETKLTVNELLQLITYGPDGIQLSFTDPVPSDDMKNFLDDAALKTASSKESYRGDYQGIVLLNGKEVLISLTDYNKNPDGSVSGHFEGTNYEEVKNLVESGTLQVFSGRDGKLENIDVNMADGASSFTGPTAMYMELAILK